MLVYCLPFREWLHESEKRLINFEIQVKTPRSRGPRPRTLQESVLIPTGEKRTILSRDKSHFIHQLFFSVRLPTTASPNRPIDRAAMPVISSAFYLRNTF